jgi:hypothetical protein
MSNLEFIARSQNGIDVVYDPVHSHATTHLDDTPQLMSLVQEVVGDMALKDEVIATHVDMGRVVGTCDVINVGRNDDIVYGVRKNRDDDGYVPFVKNREGDPCQFVTVQLHRLSEGSYELASCWIGTFDDDEPFPQSANATEQSKDFWSKHAFVWGSQEIQIDKLREDCPW